MKEFDVEEKQNLLSCFLDELENRFKTLAELCIETQWSKAVDIQNQIVSLLRILRSANFSDEEKKKILKRIESMKSPEIDWSASYAHLCWLAHELEQE